MPDTQPSASALSDEQRAAISTAIAAMRKTGWDHRAPILQAMLQSLPAPVSETIGRVTPEHTLTLKETEHLLRETNSGLEARARLREERRALHVQVSEPIAPEGYALVPLVMNREMVRVVSEDEWAWEDVLVAAESITEEQYDALQFTPPREVTVQPVDAEDSALVPRELIGSAIHAIDKKLDAPATLEKLRAIAYASPQAVVAQPVDAEYRALLSLQSSVEEAVHNGVLPIGVEAALEALLAAQSPQAKAGDKHD